jgi:hypothetical protein
MRRWISYGACSLVLLSCHSPAGHGSPPPPVVSTTSFKGSTMNVPPASAQAASFEMTYEKHCPGMAQARSMNVSSRASSLTMVDEAGEARLVNLTPDRIAALVTALRQAKLDALATKAGASTATCTITLRAVIDGVVKEVEESPAKIVADASAWKDVQEIIERFAGWK